MKYKKKHAKLKASVHRTFTLYHHSAVPLRVVQTSLFFNCVTTQFCFFLKE